MPPRALDDEDRAFNQVFHEEEAKIAEASALPPDAELAEELKGLDTAEAKKLGEMHSRLRLIRATLLAFKCYLGDGLAYEMPLAEVAGFLEVKAQSKSQAGRLEKLAAEAVTGSWDQGFSPKARLIDLMNDFEKERADISAAVHGKQPEVSE